MRDHYEKNHVYPDNILTQRVSDLIEEKLKCALAQAGVGQAELATISIHHDRGDNFEPKSPRHRKGGFIQFSPETYIDGKEFPTSSTNAIMKLFKALDKQSSPVAGFETRHAKGFSGEKILRFQAQETQNLLIAVDKAINNFYATKTKNLS